MDRFKMFITQVRHYLRFRKWPHKVLIQMAEANLRAGHALYFTVPAPMSGPFAAGSSMPIGVVEQVNEDGTGIIRIGGKAVSRD